MKPGSSIILMGVSGSGKSTVAQALAKRLQLPMLEGDELHSPQNIARMHAGHALTDADRADWLNAIALCLARFKQTHAPHVVTCSALRRRYRDVLRHGDPQAVFVFLNGGVELIHQRLLARHGHFMSATLLDSQFETLEPPASDENVLMVSIDQPPVAIAASIAMQLP